MSKVFIIRAGDPPPKDFVIIQVHKIPIQLAPERSKPEMARMELIRHSNGDVVKKNVNRKTEYRPTNLLSETRRDQPRNEEVKPKGSAEEIVKSEVKSIFGDFMKLYQQDFEKVTKGIVGMSKTLENTRQDIQREIADFKSEALGSRCINAGSAAKVGRFTTSYEL